MCKVIKVEEVKLRRKCIFPGQGSVQHAGGVWKGDHGLRYHEYLLPEDMGLANAVSCACGDSMQREVRNKWEVLLGEVNPLCTSHDKEGADDTVSRTTICLEATGEGEEISAMDVLSDYAIDSQIEKD